MNKNQSLWLSEETLLVGAEFPDAARKDKNEYRNRIDLLRTRITLLAARDRLLMTMHLENGNSFRQMAQLSGVTQTSIARKIHRITKRLTDNKYLLCLRNPEQFTTDQMTIAKEHFLQGLPMTKIAAKKLWSYYRVRQTVIKIKHLIRNIE